MKVLKAYPRKNYWTDDMKNLFYWQLNQKDVQMMNPQPDGIMPLNADN